MKKKVVFIDMDDTIVDFWSGIAAIKDFAEHKHKDPKSYEENWDQVPGIFSHMKPMDGAIEAVTKLAAKYEVHILTTAPWLNPSAWSDKVEWIHRYFGSSEEGIFHKKVTVSHKKQLLRGDFLIDDRWQNGAKEFGEIDGQTWIQIGNKETPPGAHPVKCNDWGEVLRYFNII